MSGNKSKIIAYNYFGGKFTWLDYLYSQFPNNFNHLIDVFGGSFCVSLAYEQIAGEKLPESFLSEYLKK